MKIQIFRTSNQFSEEPIKIGVCGDFVLHGTNDSCLCKSENKVFISKKIAEVDFGRHYLDCCKLENLCVKTVPKRQSKLNPDLVCECKCRWD